MSSSSISPEEQNPIKKALGLNYQLHRLMDHYEEWAKTYDYDVNIEEYSGPEYIVSYLKDLQDREDVKGHTLKILDAGCGTGLVGKALKKAGYSNVDGFDLSATMVEIARETSAYQSLLANADMTKKIPHYTDNQYDIILSCGVFTTGHVPPEALEELIRITKIGGKILVSIRKSYYESTSFEKAYEKLQKNGRVKLLDSRVNAPYLREEGANYLAFQVL